jgi:hypothetical protein
LRSYVLEEAGLDEQFNFLVSMNFEMFALWERHLAAMNTPHLHPKFVAGSHSHTKPES